MTTLHYSTGCRSINIESKLRFGGETARLSRHTVRLQVFHDSAAAVLDDSSSNDAMKPVLRGFLEDRRRADGTVVWFKREASVELPPDLCASTVTLQLGFHPPSTTREDALWPSVEVWLARTKLGVITPQTAGPLQYSFPLPRVCADPNPVLKLRYERSTLHSWFAWLGRVLENSPVFRDTIARLQEYRRYTIQRSLAVHRILADDRVLCDFTTADQPYLPDASDHELKLGLNVCANFCTSYGVSEGARASLRSLNAAQIPVRQIDVDQPLPAERYCVSLFHVDAPQMAALARRHPALFKPGQYRIGYWAWELPVFPGMWVEHCQHVDEVWVPSSFTWGALSAKAFVPVLVMPHSIDLEPPAGVDRAEFGLPHDSYLFLIIYDLDSYQERKNPQAAIRAYRQAFAGRSDVGLVIKIHHSQQHTAALDELRSLIRDLPNVHLIDETISREKLTRLQAACDCYVSLHRAEGFGLCIAEAMALGKPVIATNWSAPSEFLSTVNSIPVDYKLVTLDRDHGPYRKGQTWADPSTDHAAEAMGRLVADRDLGVRLGQQAQQTIRERFSPPVVGRLYRTRLENIVRWQLAMAR